MNNLKYNLNIHTDFSVHYNAIIKSGLFCLVVSMYNASVFCNSS